jgi:putative hydrolase of the HAD superfamily
MTAPAAPLGGVRAVSFDFGNTLVPIRREDLRLVVRRMTLALADRLGSLDPAAFEAAWATERERQFAEEVPRLREVDLAQRTIRVLARMRGMVSPDPVTPWDDVEAAHRSTPEEVALALDAYSSAFVATIPVPDAVGPLLERLARDRVLAICSNWPLAATIDRFVAAAGWDRHLRAVVVSQRVGTIKPDGRMFRAAEEALGVPAGAILHVGDDWAADIVGAVRAGWRAAWLRDRPGDTPLPGSEPTGDVRPDLVLDRLVDLEDRLTTPGGGR